METNGSVHGRSPRTHESRKSRERNQMTPRRVGHLALAGTICLIGAFALGMNETQQRYELSIYGNLPQEFWILVVAAYLLFGIGLVNATANTRPLAVGPLLAGLTGVSFLLSVLPALRYGTYYTLWLVWLYFG